MDFSGKQFPKTVILTAVRWYLSYALSYRNIEELICEWGIVLDHATVQRWVNEYGTQIKVKISKYLHKNFARSWRLDETYIKVKGKWCYQYRLVDKDGDTINFFFSETRDHQAALTCIRGAIKIAGFVPDKINSDGSSANEKAVLIINQELAYLKKQAMPEMHGPMKPQINYTKVKYCNNILEQDHRRVKRITDPMLGFKSFGSARNTLNGIESIAMLRKNQSLLSTNNGIAVSIADQFNLIAA